MDVVGAPMIIFLSMAGSTAVLGRGNHSFMDRLFLESEARDGQRSANLDRGHRSELKRKSWSPMPDNVTAVR